MPDEAGKSVLRRMTGLGAESVALAAMTPEKALRMGFAKAGDDALATAVGLREMSEDRVMPDVMGEGLPDPALFIRLNGPGGSVAIAVACPQVVAAVIEATTMGMVLTAAAADRRPTRTDAMLMAGFLDPALQGFASLVSRCAKPPLVEGFSCGPALPDLRAAQMSMADTPHCRYRLDLDFNNGAKNGKLLLLFPTDLAAGGIKGPKRAQWQATLENAVMGTSARMEAVLCSLKLPLGEITALKAGDVLTLNGASLDGVSLVGSDRGPVMSARLGRSGAMRAVRLILDDKARPGRAVGTGSVASSMSMAGAGAGGLAVSAPPESSAAALDLPGPMDMDAAAIDAGGMNMEGIEGGSGSPPGQPLAVDPAPMDPALMGLDPAPLDANAT